MLPPFSAASYAIALLHACAQGRDGDQAATSGNPITLAARKPAREQLLRGSPTIEAVHRALVHAFKIPAHDKNVRLVVVVLGTRENWGVRGGQAACDVDLGFEIEV